MRHFAKAFAVMLISLYIATFLMGCATAPKKALTDDRDITIQNLTEENNALRQQIDKLTKENEALTQQKVDFEAETKKTETIK